MASTLKSFHGGWHVGQKCRWRLRPNGKLQDLKTKTGCNAVRDSPDELGLDPTDTSTAARPPTSGSNGGKVVDESGYPTSSVANEGGPLEPRPRHLRTVAFDQSSCEPVPPTLKSQHGRWHVGQKCRWRLRANGKLQDLKAKTGYKAVRDSPDKLGLDPTDTSTAARPLTSGSNGGKVVGGSGQPTSSVVNEGGPLEPRPRDLRTTAFDQSSCEPVPSTLKSLHGRWHVGEKCRRRLRPNGKLQDLKTKTGCNAVRDSPDELGLDPTDTSTAARPPTSGSNGGKVVDESGYPTSSVANEGGPLEPRPRHLRTVAFDQSSCEPVPPTLKSQHGRWHVGQKCRWRLRANGKLQDLKAKTGYKAVRDSPDKLGLDPTDTSTAARPLTSGSNGGKVVGGSGQPTSSVVNEGGPLEPRPRDLRTTAFDQSSCEPVPSTLKSLHGRWHVGEKCRRRLRPNGKLRDLKAKTGCKPPRDSPDELGLDATDTSTAARPPTSASNGGKVVDGSGQPTSSVANEGGPLTRGNRQPD